VRLADNLPPL